MTTGLGLEDALEAGEHLACQVAELRTAMVDGRPVDGAQDAVGHVGRPRDLQEMASARGARLFLVFLLWPRSQAAGDSRR